MSTELFDGSASASVPPDHLHFYKLLTRQLLDDGLAAQAADLSRALNLQPQVEDSKEIMTNKLFQMYKRASRLEEKRDRKKREDQQQTNNEEIKMQDENEEFDDDDDDDDDIDSSLPSTAATAGSNSSGLSSSLSFPKYSLCYTTSFKDAATCAAFSPDNSFIAIGSADCTIKLMEVEKLLSNTSGDDRKSNNNNDHHPVLRTYYDSDDTITDVDFHPYEPLLVSSSKDGSLKFFDHSRSHRRAFKQINDAYPIRSTAFHPSGDYLLSGTDHPYVRLYDCNTFQSYKSRTTRAVDLHHDGITHVRWSPGDARMYLSSSRDGRVKLWDTLTSSCIGTFEKAHSGTEVSSAQFSPVNSNYVLSNGQDARAVIWDIRTLTSSSTATTGGPSITSSSFVREFITSTMSATHLSTLPHAKFAFDPSGNYLLCADDLTYTVQVFDVNSGEKVKVFEEAHSQRIRYLASNVGRNPSARLWVSCGEDKRARFWKIGTGSESRGD